MKDNMRSTPRASSASALAIVIGIVMTAACARAVGPGSGGEPGGGAEMFNGVIQCGYCRTTPWCRTAGSTDETPVYDSAGPCPMALQARPRAIFDRDGARRTLYCFGPTVTEFGGGLADPHRSAIGPRPAERVPNSCFFSPDTWQVSGRYLGGPYDPTGCSMLPPRMPPDSCNLDGTMSWANKLTCLASGKTAVITTPIPNNEVVINLSSSLFGGSRDAALQTGRSYLSAYANLFTAASDLPYALDGTGPLGDASGHVGYMCFMPDPGDESYHSISHRAEPTNCALFRGGCPLDHNIHPLLQDPGVDADGFVFDIDPAQSYVQYPGDAGAVGRNSVSGVASGHRNLAPSTAWVLTALHVDAAGTAKLPAGTLSDGHLDLLDLWVGQHSLPGWAPDHIEVPPARASAQINALVDGRRVSLDLLPSGPITGTWSGTSAPVVTLDAAFADSGQTYTFHVVLAARPRPAATIASLAPGLTEIACSNPAGETLNVAAGPTGFAGATEQWLLSNLPQPVGVSGSSASFALPLRAPWDPPATLTYMVTAGGMIASDARDVRVVDREPPSVTPAAALTPDNVLVDCGWGDPAADNPKPRCLRLFKASDDKCSGSRIVVESVQAYLGCSMTPVGPPQGPQDPKQTGDFCIRPATPPPGVSRGELVYSVTYHAVDGWNNRSPAQTVALKVADTVSSACVPATGGRVAFPNACGAP